MPTGNTNVVTSAAYLALCMFYGVGLIFLRHFGQRKKQWIADYPIDKQLASQLSHVHDNLIVQISLRNLAQLIFGNSRIATMTWTAIRLRQTETFQ